MREKKWVNTNADDVVTISGSIWNDDTRTVANAVNYNAQILKDTLNRIAELEKAIKLKAESEDKCKNCEYYRNPDYTRCHECKAERIE